ncbi:MAG: hypothetical protein LUD17_09270 [Bacteroidales bacterium]|nr:hypothetical protein [Bacteroidales bacterium]
MEKVFTLSKALVAVIAAVIFTACHSDDDFLPAAEDFVGTWDRYFADTRVVEDGAVAYTFNADGTCQVEVYTIFPMEDGTDTFFHHGTWTYSSGNRTLTIVTNLKSDGSESFDEDLANEEEKTSALTLEVAKFQENKFRALTEGNTEFIFRRR